MGLFRRTKQHTPFIKTPEREITPPGNSEPIAPEHLELIEDLRIWVPGSLWGLSRHDMTWWREEVWYRHTNYAHYGNYLARNQQRHRGPMVRPGPLRDVIHLDVPHAVLRSHPETPGVLPEELEGMWTDTNPAWPESSIDHKLSVLGFSAVWKDAAPDLTEAYDLVPGFAEGITAENSQPFDPAPLALSALLIYVRPAEVQAQVGQ